ncbi:MAG: L,D-transpeptidase [Acidimicrobiales bacterium]
MRTGRRVPLVTAALAAVLVTAACGSQMGTDDRVLPASTTTTIAAPEVAAAEGTTTTTLVARADHDLDVYPTPDAAAPPALTLPATTEFGSPRALMVLQDLGEWLEVSLPERPNGSTGWVLRAEVELREVDEAIDIDLAARTLTLRDGGETVLTTPVAIGAVEAPTPTGASYVVDKLTTEDPTGPYGLYALGLALHSDVFTDLAGGDGQVGIHGTNDPASIGQAVSHGCIRVPNEVSATLNDLVQLGTPVTIS